jgi:tRNA-specific adenosine deaminase 1
MVHSIDKAIPSNLSAVWTPQGQETLIGGALQGRKQFDPRGASSVCRSGLWRVALQVAGLAGMPVLVEVLGRSSYKEVKEAGLLMARKQVKGDAIRGGLEGWVRNNGDDEFALQLS